jgi:hypothetical protein
MQSRQRPTPRKTHMKGIKRCTKSPSDPQTHQATGARLLLVVENQFYWTITSAPSPLCGWMSTVTSSESCKPSGSVGGMSLPAARAFASAQCLRRTRLRMRASPRAPMVVRIASLTLLATFRRREGSRSSVSSFCSVPVAGRNMSSDIVSSRSLRNSEFVAARGASCDDAKLRAGVMSDVAEEVHDRMSSMSCKRSSAKCRAGSVSRI